ncbi:MAG: cell division protein SepF [Cyanobacteriota bacterium]|nr:cell division protein SepF [Cyanobacteriota bacterium]
MVRLPTPNPLEGGTTSQLDNRSRALDRLSRAIALSRGEFSLILACCDRPARQRNLARQIAERTGMDIWQLSLPPSATTFLGAIEQSLRQHRPEGLMVMGLESVRSLDSLLEAANFARNEFAKKFPFPLVLWVNESLLQKLRRLAPDFRSWAGNPIRFDRGNGWKGSPDSADGWQEPTLRFERFEPPGRAQIDLTQPPATTASLSPVEEFPPVRGSSELCALEPNSLDDMESVLQALRAQKAVILKMTRIDPREGQRALDFVVGGSYSLDGDWMKIAEAIFLFVPSCVRLRWSIGGESQLF